MTMLRPKLWGLVFLGILTLPQGALGQCEDGAYLFANAVAAPKGKFKLTVRFPVNWANVDPVTFGATVVVGSVNLTFDPGAFGGGGTKGWLATANGFKYLDKTGVAPRLKVSISEDSTSGFAKVVVGGKKISLDAGLSGTVGDDTTPQASFTTNTEGCTTDFVNVIPSMPSDDYEPEGENCSYYVGIPPWKISCHQFEITP